jgi:Primase C terminal 2 (PriCT-2)
VTTSQLSMCPDCVAMLSHLKWLSDPVLNTHPNMRLEIAWADVETGPNSAKTFRIDAIDDAVRFAEWINLKGRNVYVGATLKRVDTPAKGRTRTDHAAVATCLPIDVDGNLVDGTRKLAMIARPQLIVITGCTPQARGSLWIRIAATNDMALWSEVNRRSVFFSGGDRNALGTYRLMRLAGSVSFPSAKKQARGYVDELTIIHPIKAPAYDVRELLDGFPAVRLDNAIDLSGSDNSGAPTALGGNLSTRLPVNRTNVALIHSMLDALPNDYVTEYDPWLRVGFALHSFDDGEISLALWERFSKRCPDKAEGTDFAGLWAGFSRAYEGKKISLGWLWATAQEHGWRAPSRWDRSTETVG